jgi:hypothetical protein
MQSIEEKINQTLTELKKNFLVTYLLD